MRILSSFIASIALLVTFDARAATYLLLSQTNTFAAGITNAAKAYTDAHTSPPMSGTVSNNVASAGLLAVDATKTNGIAATAAHITNAWGIFDGDTNKAVSGAGTLVAFPAGGGWTQVTPDGTNSVINLSGAVPGLAKNFYYTLSTSNYVIFSNIVAGAEGTIAINAVGTPQQINFLSTYDNYSTNEIAPVFSITNRAIIAFKIGWGTDATNVMLGIKRK